MIETFAQAERAYRAVADALVEDYLEVPGALQDVYLDAQAAVRFAAAGFMPQAKADLVVGKLIAWLAWFAEVNPTVARVLADVAVAQVVRVRVEAVA